MLSFQGICKPLQKWNQRQQLNSKATPISISISTECHENELRESKHSRRRRRWKKEYKPSRMIAKWQMDFSNVYGKTRKMNRATQYFNILFSIFCVEWMKWKQQSVSNKMWKCNDGRRKCTDAKHNKNEWRDKMMKLKNWNIPTRNRKQYSNIIKEATPTHTEHWKITWK